MALRVRVILWARTERARARARAKYIERDDDDDDDEACVGQRSCECWYREVRETERQMGTSRTAHTLLRLYESLLHAHRRAHTAMLASVRRGSITPTGSLLL